VRVKVTTQLTSDLGTAEELFYQQYAVWRGVCVADITKWEGATENKTAPINPTPD